ncbi:MAG: AMIN domain-containing protein [Candidatus Sericytochromatia bacterium]|nr:AMIN domain-containing protein [Candidatus Sericytochromatia bacterium]
MPPRPTVPPPAWLCHPALAVLVGWPCAVQASAGVVLDRPAFERETNAVVVPYQGSLPRSEVRALDGGTRLLVDFLGSQTRAGQPTRLGVFHPLVNKIEMAPLPGEARVRVTLSLAAPARVEVVPDARRGVVRLYVVAAPVLAEPPRRASLPEAGAEPRAAQQVPSLPGGGPEWPPGGTPAGQVVLTGPRAAVAPYTPPSPPPVRFGGLAPLPGTPASGDYVYRKAIAGDSGRDVTEVQIRTPRRSDVEVDRTKAGAPGVTVTVAGPPGVPPSLEAPPATPLAVAASTAAGEGWLTPLPNEPWKLPVYRGELYFKPVPAADLVVGAVGFSEQAAGLGSVLAGNGSTLVGAAGHLPLGAAWNLNLAAETAAYTVSHLQVPDLTTRRDAYTGFATLEHLPIRRPWVLAVGAGYWGRYVVQRANLLGPVAPSVLFVPSLLHHGPTLATRAWVPVWHALGVAAEVQAAPWLFSGSDDVAAAIGGAFAYQGSLGVKWGQRRWAVGAGVRFLGLNSYNGVYGFSRVGPEVVGAWRF